MVNSPLKRVSFWVALSLLLITAFLMFAVYFDLLQLHIYIGPYYVHHWLSWIGATFIALFTPIYHWIKRRKPQSFKTLLGVHVFGNLTAFMFVSIHFTQQISRPAQFYPDLGTGIVLYTSMLFLVSTGFLSRFPIIKSAGKSLRFIHLSVTVTFYLIILVHILHGLGFI